MVLMAFLLMLGIHARNNLCGVTKSPRVDATSETSNYGHSKVKGRIGAFSYSNRRYGFLHCYRCYLNHSNYV